jgi:hypothetical protein
MLKGVRWYIIFGVFFSVIGIFYLSINRWVDAAWSLVLGSGNLFIGYAQTHSLLSKRLLWVLTILWVIVFAALTILKLRTP